MVGNVTVGDGLPFNTAVVCRNGEETFLYVANFSDGTVDVFDGYSRQVSSFTDPSLPRSYAPFDLQLIDGSLFITFIDRDVFRRHRFADPEHGVVAEFNPDGILLDRAEFHAGRRYDAARHRQMRERVASEHALRKQAGRASRRPQPTS